MIGKEQSRGHGGILLHLQRNNNNKNGQLKIIKLWVVPLILLWGIPLSYLNTKDQHHPHTRQEWRDLPNPRLEVGEEVRRKRTRKPMLQSELPLVMLPKNIAPQKPASHFLYNSLARHSQAQKCLQINPKHCYKFLNFFYLTEFSTN